MPYPVRILRQTKSNRIDLLDDRGFHLKQLIFSEDIESHSISGDTIAVSLENGRTEIYSARNGAYVRTV